MESIVPTELSGQPKEGFFKVVIRFRRNIVVLQILLSVECNLLGLDLTIFDLDLVTSEDDRNVFTHTSQITMPVGNVFVGNTRCDVKHNNSTLPLNVVSITKSAEFLYRKKQGAQQRLL